MISVPVFNNFDLIRILSTWARVVTTSHNNVEREQTESATVDAAIATNTTLDSSTRIVSASVTGLTITLPVASSALIGKKWTVILAANGYVDVTVSGSDTFVLPETDSTIRLDIKGSSLTLCCLSASTWGIV